MDRQQVSRELQMPFTREVLTFSRTVDTLTVFDDIRTIYPEALLIPVPSQISRSCGLAIQFPQGELAEHERYFRSLQVTAYLHQLEMKQNERGVSEILGVREIGRRQDGKKEIQSNP